MSVSKHLDVRGHYFLRKKKKSEPCMPCRGCLSQKFHKQGKNDGSLYFINKKKKVLQSVCKMTMPKNES